MLKELCKLISIFILISTILKIFKKKNIFFKKKKKKNYI